MLVGIDAARGTRDWREGSNNEVNYAKRQIMGTLIKTKESESKRTKVEKKGELKKMRRKRSRKRWRRRWRKK